MEFRSLSEAMMGLKNSGYLEEYRVEGDFLTNQKGMKIHFSELTIERVIRFEGMTNPADSSVLYALSDSDGQRKGLIVNAYGAYSDASTARIIKKINIHSEEVS